MNDKEWKEIQDSINNKEASKYSEYGMDLNKAFRNMINKENKKRNSKVRKTLKISIKTAIILFITIIILIGVIIGYFFIDNINHSTFFYTDIEEWIESEIGEDITLVSEDTDQNGMGTYIFTLDKINEIEIHSYKSFHSLEEDSSSRIYKYLFERWDNSEKQKFIIEEKYIDIENFDNVTITDYLLEYSTYIEISNYSELMDALNLIIEFEEYKSKILNWNILVQSYIKYGSEYLTVHDSATIQSKEEIIQNAQNWYFKLNR